MSKTPKRVPFKTRLEEIALLLNQKGAVTVMDLALKAEINPNYARQLLRWAKEKFTYATWDEKTDTLSVEDRVVKLPKKASEK